MNTKLNYGLLKKLYAIHSPSGNEERMIKFLISYIQSIPGNITLGKDAFGNLYAVKGEAPTYPCVVCHIDQVQRTHSKDFKAIETRDIIFGYSPCNHQIEGIGGDDKNGILIALEALKKYDSLKTVFFKDEETGCRGSSACELSFFDDCRFVLECDRRGNSDLITSIGYADLCSEQFIQDLGPEKWGYKEEQGMMTDVEALKEKGLPISAINVSCGYYNPHTDEEITVKRDLEKCWRFVQHVIDDCIEVYPHEVGENRSYGFYDEWELESEIYDLLQQDPSLTGSDLYYMYQTNYPRLKLENFERIIEEYHLLYCDEDEILTQTFKTDEEETDKEDYIF